MPSGDSPRQARQNRRGLYRRGLVGAAAQRINLRRNANAQSLFDSLYGRLLNQSGMGGAAGILDDEIIEMDLMRVGAGAGAGANALAARDLIQSHRAVPPQDYEDEDEYGAQEDEEQEDNDNDDDDDDDEEDDPPVPDEEDESDGKKSRSSGDNDDEYNEEVDGDMPEQERKAIEPQIRKQASKSSSSSDSHSESSQNNGDIALSGVAVKKDENSIKQPDSNQNQQDYNPFTSLGGFGLGGFSIQQQQPAGRQQLNQAAFENVNIDIASALRSPFNSSLAELKKRISDHSSSNTGAGTSINQYTASASQSISNSYPLPRTTVSSYQDRERQRKRDQKNEKKKDLNRRKLNLLKETYIDSNKSVFAGFNEQNPANTKKMKNAGIARLTEKVVEYTAGQGGNAEDKERKTVEALITGGNGQISLKGISVEYVKRVQDAFKLGSREEAERLIALRNEIETIEKCVTKNKRQKLVGATSSSGSQVAPSYSNNSNHSTSNTVDQLGRQVEEYKQQKANNNANSNGQPQQRPAGGSQNPYLYRNDSQQLSSDDEDLLGWNDFLPRTQYQDQIEQIVGLLAKRIDSTIKQEDDSLF